MNRTVTVNYPAPIAVGHVVEITEYADTRPEKKRTGFDGSQPFQYPVLLDTVTGIRYMNHSHVSVDGNGGNSFRANRYPLTPRAALVASAVWRGVVVACSIVMVEGLQSQHTTLVLDPAGE